MHERLRNCFKLLPIFVFSECHIKGRIMGTYNRGLPPPIVQQASAVTSQVADMEAAAAAAAAAAEAAAAAVEATAVDGAAVEAVDGVVAFATCAMAVD